MNAQLRSDLLHSMVDFSRLRDFVKGLKTELEADAAVLRFLDFRDWTYPITINCGSEIFGEAFFDAYDSNWGVHDPQIMIGFNRTLPPGTPYICSEHFSEEDRKTMPYFSEFLPDSGIKWLSGYLEMLDAETGTGFMLARKPGRPPFDENTATKLRPIIDVFCDTASNILHSQRQLLVRNAMALSIEGKAVDAMCMDEKNRVLWKTGSIDSIFADIPSFSIEHDCLIGKTGDADKVVNMIRSVASGQVSKLDVNDSLQKWDAAGIIKTIQNVGPMGTGFKTLEPKSSGKCYDLCLNPKDKEPVYFSAQPVMTDFEGMHYSGLRGCLLYRKDQTKAGNVPLGGGVSFSSLTRKEKEVTRYIAEGMKTPEIALLLGVEASTIRTHAKRIYRKLNVKSQSQLAILYVQQERDT